MLKKYKNGFIDLIEKNGLQPNQFEVQERSDENFDFFSLKLRSTSLYFDVQSAKDDYHWFDAGFTRFAEGFPLLKSITDDIDDPDGLVRCVRIEIIYKSFEGWINGEAKVYLEEQILPDLWDQIKQQESFIATELPHGEDSEKFSDLEKAQIRLGLKEFTQLIETTFEPTLEQMKLVEERIRYLSDALDRLNRFDWRALLISFCLSISIQLTLDTTRGKMLFDLLRKVFWNIGHLLQ